MLILLERVSISYLRKKMYFAHTRVTVHVFSHATSALIQRNHDNAHIYSPGKIDGGKMLESNYFLCYILVTTLVCSV